MSSQWGGGIQSGPVGPLYRWHTTDNKHSNELQKWLDRLDRRHSRCVAALQLSWLLASMLAMQKVLIAVAGRLSSVHIAGYIFAIIMIALKDTLGPQGLPAHPRAVTGPLLALPR